MVLYRSGRMTKMKKIDKALERAHNEDEAYGILDSSQFKLSWPEITAIVNDWKMKQKMLAEHGKGVFATPEPVVV